MNGDILIYVFQICAFFVSCPVALVRTFSDMLHSSESGHSCLFPVLGESIECFATKYNVEYRFILVVDAFIK